MSKFNPQNVVKAIDKYALDCLCKAQNASERLFYDPEHRDKVMLYWLGEADMALQGRDAIKEFYLS